MKQIRPAVLPQTRFDLDGHALFLHNGFTVDVEIRHPNEDDIYDDLDGHDVVIIGTVDACLVEVASSIALAVWSQPRTIDAAVREVVETAAADARRKLTDLAAYAEKADRETAKEN